MAGISRLPVHDTPVAIVDCETTGLNAKFDRVVEVSVVRCVPGESPKLVFDTLVNPGRAVKATEIHGITDEDVADAPTFEMIAGDLARATSGCVITAYNAYFDLKFLSHEFERSGISFDVFYLCLMYMRPMLGLGSRCSLGDACIEHGINHTDGHVASSDAFAASKLWKFYLDFIRQCRLTTFEDLTRLRSYKFQESFLLSPLNASRFSAFTSCDGMLSRSTAWVAEPGEVTESQPSTKDVNPLGVYWEALKAIIYDLKVTDEEEQYIKQKGQELSLSIDEIRGLHAKLYAAVISQFIDDRLLDEKEAKKLQRLTQCLSRLGWAPGE